MANTKDEPKAPESTLPQVEAKSLPVVPGSALPDGAYSGVYINNQDGEPYALAVVRDDPEGKTHKAKNNVHFWEGTAQEFKDRFDKK